MEDTNQMTEIGRHVLQERIMSAYFNTVQNELLSEWEDTAKTIEIGRSFDFKQPGKCEFLLLEELRKSGWYCEILIKQRSSWSLTSGFFFSCCILVEKPGLDQDQGLGDLSPLNEKVYFLDTYGRSPRLKNCTRYTANEESEVSNYFCTNKKLNNAY